VVSVFSRKLTRFAAAGAAAVAVAIGGVAITNSGSSNGTSGTPNVAQAAAPGQGPRSAHLLATHGARSGHIATGQAPTARSGQLPAGWRPGAGTLITGVAAEKAKAAALAEYSGTVNRVLQLSDGSYAVHLLGTSGPHHVFVSKDFKVTGTA
jgi:hypothetical protein